MTELPKNLDTVLHIGAGKGDELSCYLSSNAKRIILVEPNPTLAESLRQRAVSDKRVQVLELAISDNASLNQLVEYNLPEATSLYHPTGLQKVFPGLRIITQHLVDSQTPEQFLEKYPVEGDHNLLILQAPGAEWGIVNNLIKSQRLSAFCGVQLTGSPGVYYDGGSSVEDILDIIKEHGFDVLAQDDCCSDWVDVTLRFNPLHRELEEVNAQLNSTRRDLTEKEKRIERLTTELEEKNTQLVENDQRIEQLKKELQAKNNVLDAKSEEINDLKFKNRRLNDTNNDIQARQQILEEELGKAEAQIELIQELLLEDEPSEASKKEEKDKHE